MQPAVKGADAERRTNRLAAENSPYLLQHADNPVDWHPWGDEAFETARRLDRPIFLSIGYSTCHWCHVMAHESFEDPDVARAMNETFVSVKVDREERPDIDQQYMTVAQMLTGRGGWPLTLMLTADGLPFFAATYIPKESRLGMLGMLDLVPKVRDLWQNDRAKLLSIGGEVARHLEPSAGSPAAGDPGEDLLAAAATQLSAMYDRHYGGFGYAPKFPVPHYLLFLMRYHDRTGDPDYLSMVEETLSAMRRGGIFDQLGGGFHRYSTDQEWHVPHFEKMLYDQAMLVLAYTEAYQLTGKDDYRTVAVECLEYVLRDLLDPSGIMYSAEDADSEGVEGKFYLWTLEEVQAVLEPFDAKVAKLAFGITAEGNVAGHPGLPAGANVFFEARSPSQVSVRLGIAEDEARERIARAKAELYASRERRVRPDVDDKCLTDWNGLAIAALSRAGAVFGSARYQRAARRAAEFLLERMKRPDGRLFHRYRHGDAAIEGLLDDYAFVVFGLIELYAMDFDPAWLREALALHETMLDLFLDTERGGLFFTPVEGDPRIVRRKEAHDGAIPSGNSVAMSNGIRLSRLTGTTGSESEAAKAGRAFAAEVQASPTAHLYLLAALDMMLGPSSEVVVAGDPLAAETQAMLDLLHRRFLPRTVALFIPPDRGTAVSAMAPFTEAMRAPDRGTVAYVCAGRTCRPPLVDAGELEKVLGEIDAYRQHGSDRE